MAKCSKLFVFTVFFGFAAGGVFSYPPACAADAAPAVPAAPEKTIIDELTAPVFQGRAAGTQGLAAARDRLAEEFKKSGFLPAIAGGKYLQPFSYFAGNIRGADEALSEAASVDFVPLAFSKTGKAESLPLVFAGYGITAQAGNRVVYDDYRGMDVRGKAVLVMLGDPGIGAEKSFFRDPKNFFLSSMQQKAETAERKGAKAIIFVRGPKELSGTAEPALHYSERLGNGAIFDILCMRASLAWAEKMLGAGQLAARQEKIAQTQKPASFAAKAKVSLAVDLRREVGELQNIVAVIPGHDPALAKEFIVIGAHYDHLGMGGENSREPGEAEILHPGADDNASGVYAVIQTGKQILSKGKNRRPILLALFSGEEIGLLGSHYFAENPPIAKEARIVAMVNFDMVGRMQKSQVNALAANSAYEFPTILNNANRKLKLDLELGDSGIGNSDQYSFIDKKIPAIFFTTGAHEDYHRASDTAEKINYEGIARVVELASSVVARIDQVEQPPHFAASKSAESMRSVNLGGHGYGAYFGTVPDLNEGNQGIVLRGVKPNSPAEKAGLKEKDILTGLGDVQIKNLYDFVYALRFYRAGDEVAVSWLREGNLMTGKTKLEVREEQRSKE